MSTAVKKVLDERIKHRLIGMVVIVSLMVIFLPAMMRQSHQRLDELVSFRLPKEPILPQVAKLEKEPMFKTMKIAKITIPVAPSVSTQIAEAKPLSTSLNKENTIQDAKITIHKQQIAEAKAMHSNEVFTIQLATFSQEINAKTLVKTLRAKGF
ncbi:MAG TPA: SPOR domain-containing protein [Legionellaceae bacterium]|nr:SPOR domain-containing protein [Legionellaceae bacterium]